MYCFDCGTEIQLPLTFSEDGSEEDYFCLSCCDYCDTTDLPWWESGEGLPE